MLKNIIKHTPDSFCQGLVLHDNILFESSGLYSKSFIQKYIDSNNIVRKSLPCDVFAEGICIFNNILYCLTWQKSRIFAYDLELNLIYNKKFILDECWGLTTDGKYFIVSDGSNKIYWINPLNYDIVKIIKLEYNNINALTYADNSIFANIYRSNYIVKIDVDSSKVVKKWNMSKLFKYEPIANQIYYVLNGITYIPNSDSEFYITGKCWNNIYKINLK